MTYENKEVKELTKEIAIIIGVALFLGFLLALKFKWPILSFEPFGFFIMFLLSLLMLGIFVGSQKIVAYKLDCKTRTKLLTIRRYWFGPRSKFDFAFPTWLVLPVVLFFITIGRLKWLAILDLDIEPKSTRRRRKFYALTEDDVGKITLIGPVAVLALAIIVKVIGLASGIVGFASFALVCTWFAFLSLIPIGLGFKLFLSSRLIWLLTFIFSFLTLLLMSLQSLAAIIFIALLFAAIATISYYLLYERS